ncbi:MAG TPA: MFS transporter [Paludibacteraceae bacterium]|nr:MFS transporter [Paludibacteraceae bacterium]
MKNKPISPWAWIPSLYFGQGIPYVVAATTFSLIMYKNMGISNADAALYTSWLYLPWVLKPFWSPFVDLIKTKRWWILLMQFVIGIALAGVAFAIPLPYFLQSTLAILWLIAFSSATHDIAADGFYMLALDTHEQSLFVGIRSTFYRVAMIVGQGALVMLAGYLETTMPSIAIAWSITFYGIAVFFFALVLYHWFVLPKPSTDIVRNDKRVVTDFFATFGAFFTKKGIWLSIVFILLYRLGEAQLVKIASPFLLDPRSVGGLGLTTSEVGFVYGTIGVIALTLGGILGGIVAAKDGLKHWLWIMVIAMNLPNLVYVYFAYMQPDNFYIIASGVAIEQFGYGFGFTAFMLYLIYIAKGEFQTAHYAIATGFMALGMMLPGMFAGILQEYMGYFPFFVWVCICTIPGFLLIPFLKIDPSFGKKE